MVTNNTHHCTKQDSQTSQGSTRMAPRGQILQKKKNIRYIQPINMIKLTVSSSYWQQVNSFSAGETKHQVVGSYIRDSRHKCDMF